MFTPGDRLWRTENIHFGERTLFRKSGFVKGAYDKSVYVGEGDDFHRLFEVEDRDVHEHRGLSALGGFCGPRLWDLYRKILKYI